MKCRLKNIRITKKQVGKRFDLYSLRNTDVSQQNEMSAVRQTCFIEIALIVDNRRNKAEKMTMRRRGEVLLKVVMMMIISRSTFYRLVSKNTDWNIYFTRLTHEDFS